MKNISFIKLSIVLLVLGMFSYSCKKDTNSAEPTDPTVVENINEHASFYSSATENTDRLAMLNEAVVLTDTSLERNACTKYTAWTKVAEVSSFPNDGATLSATHVSQAGDIVAVSYHLRGAEYKGIVEVWDVSNSEDLKWKGYVEFVDADINAIVVEKSPVGSERHIWVALADKRKGAMVAELQLKSNNKFEENHLRLAQLTKAIAEEIAPSANSIVENGDYIHVSAGKSNGGIFTLDKANLEVVGVSNFPNAKGVAVGSFGKIAGVQTEGPGGIYSNITQLNTIECTDFYQTTAITHQNVAEASGGKVSAAFSYAEPNYLFVAAGDAGVVGYNLSSSEVAYTMPEGFLRNGNSNGISFDDEFMYVANGADGIAICSMNGALPDESSIFLWDMDEPDASANFISADNGWVVIAKGEGGFKLLKKARPGDQLPICDQGDTGIPSCLSNEVTVCGTIVDRLNEMMPINVQVAGAHPQLFVEGAVEILIEEETKLKMTFIEENTDLTNSIGFYMYHEECPPASADDLIGMVLFENYSGLSSDGFLQSGNTVKLPGTFKPGTRVGFFMVRNGFEGTNDILYSNPSFNDDEEQRALLFVDDECGGDVIGTFQANPVNSADADFRDGTFKITPSNPGAIDATDYNRI